VWSGPRPARLLALLGTPRRISARDSARLKASVSGQRGGVVCQCGPALGVHPRTTCQGCLIDPCHVVVPHTVPTARRSPRRRVSAFSLSLVKAASDQRSDVVDRSRLVVCRGSPWCRFVGMAISPPARDDNELIRISGVRPPMRRPRRPDFSLLDIQCFLHGYGEHAWVVLFEPNSILGSLGFPGEARGSYEIAILIFLSLPTPIETTCPRRPSDDSSPNSAHLVTEQLTLVQSFNTQSSTWPLDPAFSRRRTPPKLSSPCR